MLTLDSTPNGQVDATSVAYRFTSMKSNISQPKQ